MPSLGPTMRRKQLGARLRQLRRDADVTMENAALVLDCARSRIGHIENGRNSVRKPELMVLLDLYGADDETREVLEALRREASKRGWWSTYRLPSWLQSYVGLETDATTLRAFECELIPGLLQTEAYAREVHVVGGVHTAPPDEVERRVAARMQRQQRLSDPDPLTLSVVVSEAALRRTLAHGTLAAEQLRHLQSSAQLPNVALHVLPFGAGLHRSMSGSFTLLSFPPGVSVDIAYQEYAVGGDLIDDQEIVQRLSTLYDELRDQALGADESLDLISELMQQTEGEASSA
ncbi:MAG: helix-turn-helix domain-containing protein [Pseudonocardiaceae bacterium]|nr:helix-turn-helix domain-containing protein [Pseudonocardiaceae bacterium]